MIKNFTIEFHADSYIADNKKLKEVGKICVRLDDYVFPDKEWTDFGKRIVFFWMDNFSKLLSGDEKKVQCEFMDGNYRFDVEVTDMPKIWRIFLIREWADAEQLEQHGEIEIMQATDEILRVAAEIKSLEKKTGKVEYLKNVESFMQKFLTLRQKHFTSAE